MKKWNANLVLLITLVVPACLFPLMYSRLPGLSHGQFAFFSAIAGYFGGRFRGLLYGPLFFPTGIALTYYMGGQNKFTLIIHLIVAIFFSFLAGSLGYLRELKTSLRELLELEKKEHSELIRKSELLEIVETSVKVGLWNLEDYQNFKGLFSKGAYTIFGQKPRDTFPSKAELISWIHPQDQFLFTGKLNQIYLDHKEFLFIFRVVRDNEVRWIQANGKISFLNNSTSPLFLGLFTDVTDIHFLRIGMIEKSKMAALGEMASGIAHEINNPLTIILGQTGQILRLTENDQIKTENLQNKVIIIEKMVNRIANIIKGLRVFSRDFTNDPKVPIEILDLIVETKDLCHEKIKSLSIDLKIICPQGLKVNCVPTQISQILVNLISNACDAIANLPSKWISIEVRPCVNEIKIFLTDSGTGISEQIAEKIMQPFFTTKEIGKGTGLGLSISIGIANRHGGSLHYNPNFPNTQFVLTLPLSLV